MAAFDAEFAHHFVTQPSHVIAPLVDGNQIGDDRQHVDDRLGMKSGNRRAADVMDREQVRSHGANRPRDMRRKLDEDFAADARGRRG